MGNLFWPALAWVGLYLTARFLGPHWRDSDRLNWANIALGLKTICWPFSAHNWTQWGNVLGDLQHWPQAQHCFKIALRCNSDWIEAHLGLGTAALLLAPQQAHGHFLRAYQIRRGPIGKIATVTSHLLERPDPRILKHEVQQLEYLLSQGLLDNSWGQYLPQYQQSLNAPKSIPPATYQRAIYLEQPESPGRVLQAQTPQQQQLWEQRFESEGLCVIDHLLTPECVPQLLSLCQNSTIWHHAYANGYWGAYLDDGLNAPILYQMATALQYLLPGIIGNHPLVYLWAFKAEAGGQGVALHHDSAQVNLNLWLTPDSANRNPHSGGICVYPQAPPPEWDLERYSLSPAQMRQFVEHYQAEPICVPYRQNRAVIFDSRLLHYTQDYDFRPGFANQRINLTLLFGSQPLRSAPRHKLPAVLFQQGLR